MPEIFFYFDFLFCNVAGNSAKHSTGHTNDASHQTTILPTDWYKGDKLAPKQLKAPDYDERRRMARS